MLSLKLNLFQIDFKFVFCQHLHFEIQILLGIGYQNDFNRIEGYINLMTLFFKNQILATENRLKIVLMSGLK